MTSVLYQQATCRCRDKVFRDGKIAPCPCDRYMKTETLLPFTPDPGPHQLSAEVSPPKAICFKSTAKVGNRAKLRDRVLASTSHKGTSPSRLHHRISPTGQANDLKRARALQHPRFQNGDYTWMDHQIMEDQEPA